MKKSKGIGNLSIEEGENDGKKFYLCVFRSKIGQNLFTG